MHHGPYRSVSRTYCVLRPSRSSRNHSNVRTAAEWHKDFKPYVTAVIVGALLGGIMREHGLAGLLAFLTGGMPY